MNRNQQSSQLLVVFGLVVLLGGLCPSLAQADAARVQGLGGARLFTEDPSFVFTNPAQLGEHGNRLWFSLGITGGEGALGLDPHGGGAVRIKEVVSLGVALNRSPLLYGFDAAIWPVTLAYMPEGPGGPLEGPEVSSDSSAPLRFPLDLLLSFGDSSSKLRFGLNFYYAGGRSRSWDIDDSDQDDLEQSDRVDLQTHLFNVTLGLSGGTRADRRRGELWLRVGNMSSWRDALSTVESSEGVVDSVLDQILTMDRNLRLGLGGRLKLGDGGQGLLVSPAFSYDLALGDFRFEDNLVVPSSRAENSERQVRAHDARLGVGVSYRRQGLLVQGSLAARLALTEFTDLIDLGLGDYQRNARQAWDLRLPELSLGAEYELLPWLLIRAGMRSSVVGGISLSSLNQGVGAPDASVDFSASQELSAAPAEVHMDASFGLGFRHKGFALDAILGGLFLGEGVAPQLLSRVDMSFSFD
ncbi:MAG: hypothetical protein CMP23_11210 [Rickettsiales bacterium]|nr:hypothetical protein [Rickettsiales bacterium]